jgi:hypothetical protein
MLVLRLLLLLLLLLVLCAYLWVVTLLLQLCHCLHHHVAHAAVGEYGHVSALTHHLQQHRQHSSTVGTWLGGYAIKQALQPR